MSLVDLFRVYGRIGILSFGGPAGQIALMHKVLVEERKWLDERQFLHALNYCMLLPGPEAMQLATYSGWLVHGVRGGLLAGLLFVVPGALVIVALSALYLLHGDAPLMEGLFFGLKAAVLAVVAEAVVKLGRRTLHGRARLAIAALALIGIAFLAVPFPLIVAAAAIAGYALNLEGGSSKGVPDDLQPVPALDDARRPSWRRLGRTVALGLAIWLGPLLLLWLVAGGGNIFVQQGAFFSMMAVVTFGGAYAVLAWVAQQAVEIYGWLRPDEMLTGIGLAEATPGPLILVLAFVGFLGGARLSGLDPVIGGLAGALTTLWFTFAPSFLWIFAGAPYVETARNMKGLSSALSGVTAAVVGIIANLAMWFAIHILFQDVGRQTMGLLSFPVPDPSSFVPSAAAIALASAICLMALRINLVVVLAAAALAGVLLV